MLTGFWTLTRPDSEKMGAELNFDTKERVKFSSRHFISRIWSLSLKIPPLPRAQKLDRKPSRKSKELVEMVRN